MTKSIHVASSLHHKHIKAVRKECRPVWHATSKAWLAHSSALHSLFSIPPRHDRLHPVHLAVQPQPGPKAPCLLDSPPAAWIAPCGSSDPAHHTPRPACAGTRLPQPLLGQACAGTKFSGPERGQEGTSHGHHHQDVLPTAHVQCRALSRHVTAKCGIVRAHELTQFQHQPKREREREKYYTYPALRLIQVLPGHPLADSKDETVSSLQRPNRLVDNHITRL